MISHDPDHCPTCESTSPSLVGSINTPEGPQLCHDPFHITRAPLGPRKAGLIPGQVTYQPPNAHVTDKTNLISNPPQDVMLPCPRCGTSIPEYAICVGSDQCRETEANRLRAENPIKEFGQFPLHIIRHMTVEISDEQARALAELLAKLPEVNRKAVEARSRRNDAHQMIHISEDDFRTLIQQHRPLGHIVSTHHPSPICTCQLQNNKAHEPTKLTHPGPGSSWLTHFCGLLALDYYYPSNLAREAEQAVRDGGDKIDLENYQERIGEKATSPAVDKT